MLGYEKLSEIEGAYLFRNFFAADRRGSFLKILQKSKLPPQIAEIDFTESYISTSQKNVIRGMHFQLPPYDVDKLVTVVNGAVLDVVLDMRKNSPAFGKSFAVKLGEGCEFRSFYIPTGCAHGFLALRDGSMMLYQTTCEFAPAHDTGIRYDSFGFDWQISQDDMIISEKDLALPPWNKDVTVFI